MKDLSLLAWLTQTGFSVAVPLGGCVFLSVWLKERFFLGEWVIWVGIVIGMMMAIDGLISSLKTLRRLSKQKPEDTPPTSSFNDHH